MFRRFPKFKLNLISGPKKSPSPQSQAEVGMGNGAANGGGQRKAGAPAGNGLLNMGNLPQPQWTRFEDATPYEPEEHVVMYCMNGQDNVPTRIKLDNEFVYYISQSRSPGHKDQGQDCMAHARQGDWEVHLLCDGHDRAGHMVALGVCQQLPKIILRRIKERNEAADFQGDVNDAVSDSLMNDSFDECARVVCWTRDGISVGIWVKVFDGQWADKPGYIKESNGQGRVRVAIIDENGYHLPAIDRGSLRRPRYTGGCTALCLIRNRVTKECKIGVSGDSRMLILPTMGVNDAILLKQFGVEEANEDGTPKPTPQGLITPAHNVFNDDERERLERDYQGQYEFDGNFLVNPITKFAIQPTRGFGDFDMFGTGYTHSPEITKTFKLEPNGLIFSASDGVFDSHVWNDDEIVSCLNSYVDDNLTNAQIVENMYRETLQRSLEGGYVDDISIYCFREPGDGSTHEKKLVVPEIVTPAVDLPNPKKVKKKKDTKRQRQTLDRGADGFTDLSAQVLELKRKRLAEEQAKKEGKEAETAENGEEVVEKLEDFVGENDAVIEGVGNVMKNMAVSHRLENQIDPKELLTGNSFEMSKEEAEELVENIDGTEKPESNNADANEEDTAEEEADQV